MDYEYLLRCLYYLAKIIAISPETFEALRKWWTSFKEFLPSLQYPDMQEESPPPAPFRISVFDTIPVRENDVTVALTGLEMRIN